MQWLVLRRVRADYSSEWARWPAGIELTGALFFFPCLPFSLHLFSTGVFLSPGDMENKRKGKSDTKYAYSIRPGVISIKGIRGYN